MYIYFIDYFNYVDSMTNVSVFDTERQYGYLVRNPSCPKRMKIWTKGNPTKPSYSFKYPMFYLSSLLRFRGYFFFFNLLCLSYKLTFGHRWSPWLVFIIPYFWKHLLFRRTEIFFLGGGGLPDTLNYLLQYCLCKSSWKTNSD